VLPLQLSPEELRRLADRVSDAATDFLAALEGSPIFPPTSGPGTAAVFERPAAEEGMGEAAFDGLAAVAEHARAGNGRLFAHVVGSG
jgi:hypothetical protein